MNKYFILIVVIFISLLVVGIVLLPSTNNGSTDPTSSLKWGTDLNQATQVAKDTNKKIFVYFSSDWCAYCTEMDEVTFQNPQVIEKLTQNYVLLKVNVDENAELSQKYQAYSLPTIVILDYNGNEINRIIGYQSPQQLLSQI
jgi:thiol:disulfide interchange protein DsbD